MKPRGRSARRIQERIREVLLDEWRPIGFPVPRDEYDGYIAGIYQLISRGASPDELAAHLAATDPAGTPPGLTPEALREVAAKLCAIDVRLGGEAGGPDSAT